MTEILSQLQSRFLDAMPAIPLWYNGLWAQWNTGRWSGWPSEEGNQAFPAMWRNYVQMTAWTCSPTCRLRLDERALDAVVAT